MVVIFVLVAILAVAIFLAMIPISSSSEAKTAAVCICILILCVVIPAIGNKYMETPRITILSNTYNDIAFDRVMKIEYTELRAPFHTYRAINNGDKVNIEISVYED